MSTLIELNHSPRSHSGPTLAPSQWATSPNVCMTPTCAPTGLIRMGNSASLTSSPGSSRSSEPVGYTHGVSGPEHTSSEGSEHGFSSVGSRPGSGAPNEHGEGIGDDSQSNIHHNHENASPFDCLHHANVLHAFNFPHVGTDKLCEQSSSFTSPSPSALPTSRIPNRPQTGAGRSQHPLDPIPGPPPAMLSKAKGPWHKAEDSSLMYWVSHLGTGKWVEIARRVGSRTGKQCRERWTNQLSPDIDHSAFRHDEDLVIITMQQTLQANKWCEVAKYLPGRPENAIKNRWNSRDLQRKRTEIQLNLTSNPTGLHRGGPEGSSTLKRAREETRGGSDHHSAFETSQNHLEHQNPGQQINQGSKRLRATTDSEWNDPSTLVSQSTDVMGGTNHMQTPDRWGSEWGGGHATTPPANIQRPYHFTSGGQYYSTPMQSPSYLLDSASSDNAVMSHTTSESREITGYPVTNYDEASTPSTYTHNFYPMAEPTNNSQSYYAPYSVAPEPYSVGFSPSRSALGASRDAESDNYTSGFDISNPSQLVASTARFIPTPVQQPSRYVPHPSTPGNDLASLIRPGSHTFPVYSPESHSILASEVFGSCTEHANAVARRPKSTQPLDAQAAAESHSHDASWSLVSRAQTFHEGDPSILYAN